ncbi:hypothetical protein AWRI1631_161690 [Saccharomyces cerevisiae AWRI1631]|uniref:Uncharacterized protein n=1 Tax=Saccharomyces cerevisiae (strain AWRI1631) TaxID=545124 RepID=B5VT70_YEAS6|nr:hypothetical protein AWRI1631_161690 [Saccharomyces cerevisiae AWRI1631]
MEPSATPSNNLSVCLNLTPFSVEAVKASWSPKTTSEPLST